MASAKQYRVLMQTLRSLQWLFKPEAYEQELQFLKERIKTYKLMAQIRKHAPEYTIPRFPDLVSPESIYRIEYIEYVCQRDPKCAEFYYIRDVLVRRLNTYHIVASDELSRGVYFMYHSACINLTVFDMLVTQHVYRNEFGKIFYEYDTPFSDEFHKLVNHNIRTPPD